MSDLLCVYKNGKRFKIEANKSSMYVTELGFFTTKEESLKPVESAKPAIEVEPVKPAVSDLKVEPVEEKAKVEPAKKVKKAGAVDSFGKNFPDFGN